MVGRSGDFSRPIHRFLDARHHFHACRSIDLVPHCRKMVLDLQAVDGVSVGVHADKVGAKAGNAEGFVGAEDDMREGMGIMQGGDESGMQDAGEVIGVAGLLVENEDASARLRSGGRRSEGGRR